MWPLLHSRVLCEDRLSGGQSRRRLWPDASKLIQQSYSTIPVFMSATEGIKNKMSCFCAKKYSTGEVSLQKVRKRTHFSASYTSVQSRHIRRSASLCTSKCNSVTCFRLSHVLKAITLSSDNGSDFDRAITLRCHNGSHVLKVITLINDIFLCCNKALCDNTKCNEALLL